MIDKVAHTPLKGPVTYDFGQATPPEWPQGEYVPKAVYDALAAELVERTETLNGYLRDKTRDVAAYQARIRELEAPQLKTQTPREREHDYLASRCWCGEANYPKHTQSETGEKHGG